MLTLSTLLLTSIANAFYQPKQKYMQGTYFILLPPELRNELLQFKLAIDTAILKKAIFSKNYTEVKKLLTTEFNINAPFQGYPSLLDYLLFADPHKQVKELNEDTFGLWKDIVIPMAEFLLKNGANINSVNANGDTILNVFIKQGQFSEKFLTFNIRITFLLNHGANPNILNHLGQAALDIQGEFSPFARTWLENKLREHGAKKGNEIQTELIGTIDRALWSKDFNMIQTLLSTGFDINASFKGYPSLLHYVFFTMPNYHVDSKYYLLWWKNYILPMTEFLLKNGANINAVDANGDTLLHLWIKRGIQPVGTRIFFNGIQFLLRHGANPTMSNLQGETALGTRGLLWQAIQRWLDQMLKTLAPKQAQSQ